MNIAEMEEQARLEDCRERIRENLQEIARASTPTQRIFRRTRTTCGKHAAIWTPSPEKHLGYHVSGVARGDGVVDRSFGRKLGLGW